MESVKIEHAQMIFKNFSGRKTKFKPAGFRSFNLKLDDECAEMLEMKGLRVKRNKLHDEDMPHTIPVALNYDRYPPLVVEYCGDRPRKLTEETVAELDQDEIQDCDMYIWVHPWKSLSGDSGFNAILKSMEVHIIEDDIASKYAAMAGDDDDDDCPF